MAFNTRISPHQCQREQFTPILICFKCYAYETHPTNECPSTRTLCSECGQEGHRHDNCKSPIKQCLHCPPGQNNHRTLAPSCPTKKKAIRTKQQRLTDEKDKINNKTYSDIVKTAIKETEQPTRPTINLSDKTHLKLVVLIIEAHVASLTGSRPYGEILSASLRLNYDLDVKLPDRDSQNILDLYLKPPAPSPTSPPAATTPPPIATVARAPALPLTPIVTHRDTTDADVDTDPEYEITIPQLEQAVKPKQKHQKKRHRPTPSPNEQTDTETTKRQDTRKTKSSTTDSQISVRVFRSRNDPESIPDKPEGPWFFEQTKLRNNYGLKMEILGDMDYFNLLLARGQFAISPNRIHEIDDETFQQLPRIRALTND